MTEQLKSKLQAVKKKPQSARFRLLDGVYIAMMIVPFVIGMLIKVLTEPASEGIQVTGALIYTTIPMPLQDLPITESQVNSWLVMIAVTGLCLFLTHGLSERACTKRQLIVEYMLEMAKNFVTGNMGERFAGFAPFIVAIMALSAFSSLSSLVGMYPPTSDINVVAGWAILVFFLITYYKLKGGLGNYLKSFADPIPVFAPFNVISEFAVPVSMSFRHYGNVLSGSVIAALVAAGLQGLSSLLLGWLPGFLGKIPFLQIGIPAVLSVYFDVFSGCLQAFIFAMLTMLYIANGFPEEAYNKRMARKAKRKSHTA